MVAVIKGAEVSDSASEVIQSYYDQLGCLETKIPFSQAKIYFKWLDAFVGRVVGRQRGLHDVHKSSLREGV